MVKRADEFCFVVKPPFPRDKVVRFPFPDELAAIVVVGVDPVTLSLSAHPLPAVTVPVGVHQSAFAVPLIPIPPAFVPRAVRI